MTVPTTDDSPQTVVAVERAFSVLHALAGDEKSQGVSAISRTTALPKSTVSRLLNTLDHLGAVERAGDRGRYRLGPTLALFGARSSSTLVELARHHLQDLVDTIGEDAGLSVSDGFDVLYVDQIQASKAIKVMNWTGSRLSPHAVASGYVLMRAWDVEKLDEFLAEPLESLTRLTCTDPGEVVDRVRGWERYAWTRGEFFEDLNGVAAPIHGPDGSIAAAVNLYGPAYRFPGERTEEEVGALLADAGDRISHHLSTLSIGHRP